MQNTKSNVIVGSKSKKATEAYMYVGRYRPSLPPFILVRTIGIGHGGPDTDKLK